MHFDFAGKLWAMLREKAKEKEVHRSHVLHERQEVFQNAFIHDMDFYRAHGHVERKSDYTFLGMLKS